jgi:signal transduction histidine kinase
LIPKGEKSRRMAARTQHRPHGQVRDARSEKGNHGVLYEFIRENEPEIIARAMVTARQRVPSRREEKELSEALQNILHQVAQRLGEDAGVLPPDSSDIPGDAAAHGEVLHETGAPLPTVVFDYGAVCHAITDLAAERELSIPTREFQVINIALDDGIAAAIDAYSDLRTEHVDGQQRERLGFLAHELRNALTAAQTAFQALKQGRVGIGSSTGYILERSLGRLQRIVDRALEEVRHRTDAPHREKLRATDLFGDVESLMAAAAKERGIELVIEVYDGADQVEVLGDRQHLVSAISNLVQNAVKFTPSGKRVALRAWAPGDKLRIEVEDECGGLPPGKAEDLFRPFVQKADDRSGLGLGLTITQRTVEAHGGELRVRNLPGKGCVFEIDLKRY